MRNLWNERGFAKPYAWALVCGFALAATAHATDGPPAGQVVIKIDPARDLVATRPGWSRTVETMGPRGTTGCMERRIQHSPPLPLSPYSVSEVTNLAQAAGRLQMVRTPAGPVPMVKMADGPLVPVATYATQLTDMEKFLNTFGRSLRERGLDLGRVAALRDANLADGCKLKANQYEPVWRNPRTPIAELVRDWKLDDEVPGWLSDVSHLRRLYDARQRPVPQRRTVRDITSDAKAMEQLQNRKALLTINASDMATPAAQAPLRVQGRGVLGANRTAAQPALIQLKPGRIPGSMSFVVNGQTSTTSTLQGDCAKVIDFGSRNEGISLTQPGGSSAGGTGARDNKTPFVRTTGTPSACLNDGSFALAMAPWKGCITTGGSLNNWFGGASCVSIASNNTGNNGVMAFENTMDMGASMTIFGLDMDLLGVHASASSSTEKGPLQPPPSVSGLVATVGGGTTCCEPIAGPSIYVPIGPTGLLVTSALQMDLNAGDMKTAATTTPTGCAPGPVTVASIDGKATAQAKAQFEASMTVLIASAGIGGEITLVGGELAGDIATTADMGNNLVTVQPRIQFVSDIGSGEVYVFVEVDMLVYSKRWSLTLAEWEAYKTKQVFPHDVGTVRATRAQSQTISCAPSL